MSDEWFDAIWWIFRLFGIFIIKECIEFSLTSFYNLTYDCLIKATEMFNFLRLINNSVTVGLSLFIINHISNNFIKN